ncbi:MAG: TetR/AcrR family transcriptional regulator [Fibrobacter sp.]|nr:TetR/AcrR family transcriptional regulator [Fibrobacter sp.]
MDKKQIQEERIKNFFLSAAKELIRAEGIEVVSARNVAERAGYSYATLYNYFKDIRDLIFSCAQDFMDECRGYIFENIPPEQDSAERLNSITICYTRFFVQYPGIFELLYQQKVSTISTPDSKTGIIYSFFDSLTNDSWQEYFRKKQMNLKQAETIRKNHKLAIHGLLLFYLNRRMGSDYAVLMEEVRSVNEYFIAP